MPADAAEDHPGGHGHFSAIYAARLPASSGGVIAVSASDGAKAVNAALAHAVKKSVAKIDGASAKALKAGLAEAQAGMGVERT